MAEPHYTWIKLIEGDVFSYNLNDLSFDCPFLFRSIVLLSLAGFLVWIQVEYDFFELVWELL